MAALAAAVAQFVMQGVRPLIALLDAAGAVEVVPEPVPDEDALPEDDALDFVVELCADTKAIELMTTTSVLKEYIFGSSGLDFQTKVG